MSHLTVLVDDVQEIVFNFYHIAVDFVALVADYVTHFVVVFLASLFHNIEGVRLLLICVHCTLMLFLIFLTNVSCSKIGGVYCDFKAKGI